ncbi:Os07g0662550 [Oryza sativa Japonica Group]|uniref:Os07g0662550 protein n=1 Tax=Oryza sativa subsp. japonica TaxID=39947 RepID=A0A0P0XAF9_ORYSJ|nr:hypothetical protein EE612_041193 [Oryza sativa]BAT03071.1 Os07g0662550 [Oryza sativa Japonica Group]
MAKPLIMAFHVQVFLDLNLVNTSRASSTAPHLAYMSSSAVPRNSSHHRKSLFLSTKAWIHFPVSSAPAPAHAASALRTVPRFGAKPSAIIRRKRHSASTGRLFPASPDIMAFQETRSLTGISSNRRLAAATSPARQSPATIDVHVTGVGDGTRSNSRRAETTSPDMAWAWIMELNETVSRWDIPSNTLRASSTRPEAAYAWMRALCTRA